MKNILVPTDFSPASRNAAMYAASLARYFDATVHLLNAVEPPVLADDQILASVMITQAEIIQQNMDLMQKEIEIILADSAVKIDSYVREDFTTGLIRDVAEKTDTDVIVMGMKGRGKSNSVFGSTTTAVVRKMDYPVFVIPEKASFSPIADVILASDYNAETESETYEFLKRLVEKFNSRIRIVNVAKKPDEMKPAAVSGRMKTSMAFSGHSVEFDTVAGKDVESEIEKYLEKHFHDILAMVARKHSFFDRLFGKIHTKEMSYRTKKPLLILHDK